MFTNLLSNLPASNISTTIETITSFKLTVRTPIQGRRDIENICSALNGISTRDSFELIIEAGESLFKSSCANFDTLTMDTFYDEAIELGEVVATINITKNKNQNTISVYSAKAFEKYLLSEDITSILTTVTSILEDKLHFDYLGNPVEFSTQTISFGQSLSNVTTFLRERRSIITDFKEGTSFSGVPNFKLLPDDFHLHHNPNAASTQKFFHFTCGLLSLIYLANVSELDHSNKFSFRINGYRAVYIENVSHEYIAENSQMLYKIYCWVYHASNVTDRLGLARNVLSLHLDSTGLPTFNQPVWDAIQSNYKIYLQGNIESYLEVKGKIAELLIDAISKTNQLSDNLLDSLKNNALAIVTFLITVVLINGVKDLSISAVFSISYLSVVVILVIFSGIWLYLMRKDVEDRFATASTNLGNILRRNYTAILTDAEIEQSITPVIIENKSHLEGQIKKYSRWWAVMLGAFLLLYLFGFIFHKINFTNENKESNRKESRSQTHFQEDSENITPKAGEKDFIGPRI
jgi:hypothetical protein